MLVKGGGGRQEDELMGKDWVTGAEDYSASEVK